jgi:hypothetical protein
MALRTSTFRHAASWTGLIEWTTDGTVGRYLVRIVNWLKHPLVAYAAIAALQMKVVWFDWVFRDLPTGDPATYFAAARFWVERQVLSFQWSPLYVALYGTLFSIIGDVYATFILQRLLIVVATSLIVLGAMRQILPPSIAWLIAAWWTLLESAFNVVVEVHLFVLLPVLFAVVATTKLRGAYGRATALALLVGAAILIRNELAITAILFGGLCAVCEGRRLFARHDGSRSRKRHLLVTYTVPLLITATLILFLYSHAAVKLPELLTVTQGRHIYSVCQIYAVGYQQRYTDWRGDRWLECQDLMQRQFGQPTPSLLQALTSNPRAMVRHFLWNLEILPSALQVSLFNAMSGRVTPDFVEVPRNTTVVPVLSITLLLVIVVGVWLFVSRFGEWARRSIDAHLWSWIVLLTTAIGTLVVGVVQRPKPSYVYPITIFIMALVGLSVALFGSRLPRWRGQQALVPLLMFGVLVLAPRYYDDPLHVHPRVVLLQYESLKPYAELMREQSTVFLTGERADEIAIFLGADRGKTRSYAILDAYDGVERLDAFLTDSGVTLFYVDKTLNERLQTIASARPLLSDPSSVGWVVLGQQNLSQSYWLLLRRIS